MQNSARFIFCILVIYRRPRPPSPDSESDRTAEPSLSRWSLSPRPRSRRRPARGHRGHGLTGSVSGRPGPGARAARRPGARQGSSTVTVTGVTVTYLQLPPIRRRRAVLWRAAASTGRAAARGPARRSPRPARPEPGLLSRSESESGPERPGPAPRRDARPTCAEPTVTRAAK